MDSRRNAPDTELNITWRSFGEYLAAMDELGCASNVVPFVGFGTIRIATFGFEDRAPTPDELTQMKSYVDEAMNAGAFGLSTGLIYTPQVYSETKEIIELAKVVAKHNGLYFSHIRGEGTTVIQAVKEFIEIVDKSAVIGGQIAHHKITGQEYWGTSKETLRLIEDANDRGLSVTCDQYPYNRSMTSLITVIPPWVHIGGVDELLERLTHPENQDRIKKELTEGIEGWSNYVKVVGWDKIYIASLKTEKNKELEGKSLSEITQLKENPNNFITLFDLLLEEKGDVSITVESIGESDIKQIMQGRYSMIGTDGSSVTPNIRFGKPHPRYYGTYPRVLAKYVREEGTLTLEDAIRRMTSFPAQRLGLWDRGLLKEGLWADIVCFDPKTVRDLATFEDPHQYPVGIHHVIVNGTQVINNEQHTGECPGMYLKRIS